MQKQWKKSDSWQEGRHFAEGLKELTIFELQTRKIRLKKYNIKGRYQEEEQLRVGFFSLILLFSFLLLYFYNWDL